jgi:hypothetical protein
MAKTKRVVPTPVASMYTEEQWEFIFELKCYGYTYRELGEWLGVSHTLVQDVFKRQGFISDARLPLSAYNEKLQKLGDTDVRHFTY